MDKITLVVEERSEDGSYCNREILVKPITVQTFLDAADLLEKEGKKTGRYIDEQGCGMCTVGAIMKASELPTYMYTRPKDDKEVVCFDAVFEFLEMANKNDLIHAFANSLPDDVKEQESDARAMIYYWSDHTDQSDVVAQLRKFANEQEEKAD